MSYDRMKEKEKDLKAEVKQLLEQAEAADAEEDAAYGKDQRGDELPAELERRETRIKKIREAKRALEARAREKAAAELDEELRLHLEQLIAREIAAGIMPAMRLRRSSPAPWRVPSIHAQPGKGREVGMLR